jgi:hypothetical protein
VLLEASGWRIVNVHPGMLPYGHGCLEWAVLEGHPEQVGMSAHSWMKVSTPVHSSRSVGSAHRDGHDIRAPPRAHRADRLPAHDRRRGRTGQRRDRAPEPGQTDGRQFFAMHPDLLAKASEELRRIVEPRG